MTFDPTTAISTAPSRTAAPRNDEASQALGRLLDTALSALDAEGGSVVVRDPQDGGLRIVVSRGLAGASGDRWGDETTIDANSISGWVVRTGKPLLVRDLREDPRFRLHVPRVRYRNHSLAAAPLRSGGQVLGVVHVNSKREGEFDERDLTVLTALAGHLCETLTLHEARDLYKRKVAELSRVNLKLQKTRSAYSRMHDLLEEQVDQVTVANKTYRGLANLLEPDSVFEAMDELLPDILPHGLMGLAVLDPEAGDRVQVRIEPGCPAEAAAEFRMGFDEALRRYAGRTVAQTAVQVTGRPDRTRGGLQGLRIIPLARRGRTLGVLAVGRWEHGAFSRDERRRLAMVGRQAAVTLENASLYDHTRRMAMSDSLTGLRTRRSFDKALDEELARAQRYGLTFSLLVADIDNFKHVNDTYGHQAGDHILKEVARIIREATRGVDVVGRYGGEEFVVLVPQTDAAGAAVLAEQIRRRVESRILELSGERYAPTVSLGVASFPAHGLGRDEVFAAADGALYQAKRTGKNKVCKA